MADSVKNTNNNPHRAYLEVLRKLRKLIAESYPDGGWLPSSRKLCSMFEVTRKTYSKALKCLENDGVAKAFPKKGHYIRPEFLRVKKIGIVANNSEDSPFLQADEGLCAVLRVIRSYGYNAQLIQAADLNNILDKALIHGVKGLIWLFPSPQILPLINKLSETSEIPIVVMRYVKPDDQSSRNITSVTVSSDFTVRKKVDYFIKRNHKKVAIAAKAESLEGRLSDLISLFQKESIAVVPILNDEEPDMTVLTENTDITALLIEDGIREHAAAIKELSKLPVNSLTDIYIHFTPLLATLRSMYPSVQITAVETGSVEPLGETAAQVLMDNLKNGKKLESREIGIMTIKKISEI